MEVARRTFKSGFSDSVLRKKLCHIYMKDGRYIRGMSPSKADENKPFTSSAKDHQKAGTPVTYHLAMTLVSTNEPAFPI
jgi:hypothetical protein